MAATTAPAAKELIEDVYREILLRLPADQPKLLYRCAAVCTTWRRILTEPAFLRRYCEFHRLPRLLGYLHDGKEGQNVVAKLITVDTTFDARVPDKGIWHHVIDSHHGRVIFERFDGPWDASLIIWDPVTDHHQEVALPEAFGSWYSFNFTATVLCDTPACHHVDCHGGPFRVVFVGIRDDDKGASATSAFTYTSASASWTKSPAAAAAAAITHEDDWGFPMPAPTILLYFRSPGRILRYRFGDEMEDLVYVDVPPISQEARGTVLMPGADQRLCFAALFGDDTIRFWETEVSADGAVDWGVHTQNVLFNTPAPGVRLVGAAGSFLFIRTEDDSIISVDVGSGRVRILPQPADKEISALVPFVSFHTPWVSQRQSCNQLSEEP